MASGYNRYGPSTHPDMTVRISSAPSPTSGGRCRFERKEEICMLSLEPSAFDGINPNTSNLSGIAGTTFFFFSSPPPLSLFPSLNH